MSTNANTVPLLAGNPVNGGTAVPIVQHGHGVLPNTIPVLASCNTRPDDPCCTDSVYFHMVDSVMPGFPIAELGARSGVYLARILENALGKVLAQVPDQYINVTIIWPGYEHLLWRKTIRTRHSRGQLFTRSELGKCLISQITDFCETAMETTCFDPLWEITDDGQGINWQHIELIGLEHVQAELWKITLAVM